MGLFQRKRLTEAVRDVAMETARSDALKIDSLLKGSPYIGTMEWRELVVRFKRTLGLSEEDAVQRLENALQILTKSQAYGWGGRGCAVHFSRTIPVVVV